MEMLSVLEPSVLHVSMEDWRDESLVARFEQRWIDLIYALDDAESVGFDHRAVLSLAAEALIWDAATAPAWSVNRNARQRMLAVFAQRLRPLLESVDVPVSHGVLTEPSLDDRAAGDPWLQTTLDVLSWGARQVGDLTVQAGVMGTSEGHTRVVEAGTAVKTAAICHNHAEFLALLPLHELLVRSDVSGLPRLMQLSVQRFLSENPERGQVYALEFTDKFLDQLLLAPSEMKAHIVDAVVSRITQVQKSAQADKGLKDEPLGGRPDWRRCRVTRDWRIHYSYPGKALIRLEMVGAHDLGL